MERVQRAAWGDRDDARAETPQERLAELNQVLSFRLAAKPRPADLDRDRGRPGLPDLDWGAALDLVRHAAQSVRAAEERAREMEAHAHTLLQRASRDMEEAEARIDEADARAQAAEARAQAAEARAGEAEAWLRKIHGEIMTSFASTRADLPAKPAAERPARPKAAAG